jgi:hypothetical protein
MILLYFPQVYLPEAGTPGVIQGLIRCSGSGLEENPGRKILDWDFDLTEANFNF